MQKIMLLLIRHHHLVPFPGLGGATLDIGLFAA
jgi:hypothetical protein